MRFPCLIVILVLCWGASVQAQQLSPYLCDTNLYPSAMAESPVLLPYLTLTGTVHGTAGVLTLINQKDKNIQYYLVVMEFLDGQGQYLFSAPVYNVDKEQHIPFDVPFKPWLLANWPGGTLAPIPAGSKSGEAFGSKLVALTCPTSVRISVIWLKYEDGTEFKYLGDHINLSPATRNAVKLKSIKDAKAFSPVTVSGKIKLNEQGQINGVTIDSSDDRFKAWLAKEFAGWDFTPPWVSGKPASTSVPFLFILADNANARAEAEGLKKHGVQGSILLLSFQN
jgi:hypothetical protein